MKNLNTAAGKSLIKRIAQNEYYSIERFEEDAKKYVKAIKEGRIIASIENVSRSGMSRDIKYTEFDKKENKGSLNTFYSFFLALGYNENKSNRGYFKIGGCGMDMNFNTNYNNINDLEFFGFIKKDTARVLCQKTPNLL